MDKETKKKPKYNQDAINALIAKYGYGSYYFRQCISGNKKGVLPDEIKKEYQGLCKAIEAAKTTAITTAIKTFQNNQSHETILPTNN